MRRPQPSCRWSRPEASKRHTRVCLPFLPWHVNQPAAKEPVNLHTQPGARAQEQAQAPNALHVCRTIVTVSDATAAPARRVSASAKKKEERAKARGEHQSAGQARRRRPLPGTRGRMRSSLAALHEYGFRSQLRPMSRCSPPNK